MPFAHHPGQATSRHRILIPTNRHHRREPLRASLRQHMGDYIHDKPIRALPPVPQHHVSEVSSHHRSFLHSHHIRSLQILQPPSLPNLLSPVLESQLQGIHRADLPHHSCRYVYRQCSEQVAARRWWCCKPSFTAYLLLLSPFRCELNPVSLY